MSKVRPSKKDTRSERTRKWRGMNWISQEKRLAIYLRDGMQCIYCQTSVLTIIQESRIELDHLIIPELGGTNHERNLATACCACNRHRGANKLRNFLTETFDREEARKIMEVIRHQARQSLKPFINQARELIATHGSARKSLPHYKPSKHHHGEHQQAF